MSGTELEVPQTGLIEDAPIDTPSEPPRNPREEMMERIVAKYEEAQRREVATGEEMFQAERDARAAAEAEGMGEQQPAAPRQQRAPQQHQQPQQRIVTLQGQQFAVDEQQYARLAEIGALANIAMQQQAQQPIQLPPQHVPQQYQRAPVLATEEARDIVQRLSYGSADDGVAAVQQLAENLAARTPQVDPAQISQMAAHQALATIEFQRNLNQIGQEFPDVFNNETRAYVAAVELTKLRQADQLLGQQRPNLALYREACQRVRDALTPQGSGRGNGGAMADRAAAKRAAPRAVAGVSRTGGGGFWPDHQPRAPSASDIVTQMRRARGQMT